MRSVWGQQLSEFAKRGVAAHYGVGEGQLEALLEQPGEPSTVVTARASGELGGNVGNPARRVPAHRYLRNSE